MDASSYFWALYEVLALYVRRSELIRLELWLKVCMGYTAVPLVKALGQRFASQVLYGSLHMSSRMPSPWNFDTDRVDFMREKRDIFNDDQVRADDEHSTHGSPQPG